MGPEEAGEFGARNQGKAPEIVSSLPQEWKKWMSTMRIFLSLSITGPRLQKSLLRTKSYCIPYRVCWPGSLLMQNQGEVLANRKAMPQLGRQNNKQLW